MSNSMPMYDFDEIQAAGDCLELMRRHVPGATEVSPGRFNCPWRAGSDSGSFAVTKEGWYDHVSKEKGGVLKLVQKARFPHDANYMETQEWLGQLYGLTAKAQAKERRHKVAEYVYTDADGDPRHKTVRYEPKAFVQFGFVSGEWRPSMDGVETVLYRLPAVLSAKQQGRWVFLCEGEKDADNLAAWGPCATTSPMGAGKWHDSYTATLEHANVCMIVDKDAAGRAHRDLVCKALAGRVATLRALELPGHGKDFTDWRDAGGTLETFTGIVRAAPAWTESGAAPAPAAESAFTKELAKECNAVPFRNFRVVDRDSPRGVTREKEPIHLNELVQEVQRRFLGFPRRIGDQLFDHDRKSGVIRYFDEPQQLFAWIQEKSRQPVQWAKIEGAASQEHVFSSLTENVQRYQMISGVPNWPRRDDVYYTHGNMPEPSPDAKHFNEFMAFFSPATPADAAMLRALFASPLYYRFKVDRPLWIIDSIHGQGTGKTKLVETLAHLYGGQDIDQSEPVWADANEVTNEQTSDRVKRRLLSRSGRKKRVFLIDNVTGFFQSPTLSSMVTQGSLSGIAPYGRGEETRPNDLTYIMTANSASIDRDLAARAFFVNLARPENPDPGWSKKVADYIRMNRLNVISDIVGMLERGVTEETVPVTRFRMWEMEILAPMCGSLDAYSDAVKTSLQRLNDADGEREQVEAVRNEIRDALTASNINPDTDVAFIHAEILREWCQAAVPDFGGRSGRAIPHILRNWMKAGMLPELSERISRWPIGKGRRGMAWNCPLGGVGYDGSCRVRVVGKERSKYDPA